MPTIFGRFHFKKWASSKGNFGFSDTPTLCTLPELVGEKMCDGIPRGTDMNVEISFQVNIKINHLFYPFSHREKGFSVL